MPYGTFFNRHPLALAATTSFASKAGSFSAAALTPCSKLEAMKAKSSKELMPLAVGIFGDSQSFRSAVNSATTDELNDCHPEHTLAEVIYLHQGHNAWMQYRISDMTRLQKESQAVVLGIFTQEEAQASRDFDLSLRLSFVWSSAVGPSIEGISDDSERPADVVRNENGEKVSHCVRKWVLAQGKHLTYAY